MDKVHGVAIGVFRYHEGRDTGGDWLAGDGVNGKIERLGHVWNADSDQGTRNKIAVTSKL